MIDVDLPAAVRDALEAPTEGERFGVEAAGIPWSALAWGDPGARPLLLIHGVTSSAAIWWRVGPALAATGRRVVAVDQAGHGRTGHWQGHHRFRDNAADVAAFIRAAGLDARRPAGRRPLVGGDDRRRPSPPPASVPRRSCWSTRRSCPMRSWRRRWRRRTSRPTRTWTRRSPRSVPRTRAGTTATSAPRPRR